MLLLELLNKPLPFQQVSDNAEHLAYIFDLPDGRTYVVNFLQQHTTSLNALYPDSDLYEVTFRDENDRRHGGEVYDNTGKGSEMIIFSTVIEIIKNFIKEHPNDIISYYTEDKKRWSLYNRIVQRLVKPPLTVFQDGAETFIAHHSVIKNNNI